MIQRSAILYVQNAGKGNVRLSKKTGAVNGVGGKLRYQALAADSASQAHVQTQFTSVISEDENECVEDRCESAWKRKLAKGDRPKSILITWSHPKNPMFQKPEFYTRKEFARLVEGTCAHLGATVESMAVFREPHKNAAAHYHVLVILQGRSTRLWAFDETIFQRHYIKTFTEMVVGGSKKPHFRVLEYLMCPTPRKMEVDEAPYITKNMEVPGKLWDKAAKSKSKLENSPASPDEIYQFLLENPSVASHGTLLDLLDSGEGKNVKLRRISKFVNNNIRVAREVIAGLLARRDRNRIRKENLKTPMHYLVDSIQNCGECACPKGPGLTTLAEDVDFLVQFHGASNVLPFFERADRFFAGTLPTKGRPKNCYIEGRPTSGKSSLADLVTYIIPESRIVSPTLDSSTPFSKIRSHYLLCVVDDWRFSQKVPVTGTLQWMEGRNFGVDIKGQEAVQVEMGPICLFSSNYSGPTLAWRELDIQAFRDRCYTVRMEHRIPPLSRKEVGDKMKKCASCRVQALAQYSPCVRATFARIKGEVGQATNNRSNCVNQVCAFSTLR